MHSLSNFEEYSNQSLEGKSILAWWKDTGYYFMTFQQARKAYAEGVEFIIKGVEK